MRLLISEGFLNVSNAWAEEAYVRKRKKPLMKYTIPETPVKRPSIQTILFFIKAAIDERSMAICRNITAIPNA